MKKNGALDIIFKIFAILLCIILVPALIVTVLVGSVSNIVTPKTVVKVVKSIDFQEVILQNEDLAESLEEMNISDQSVQQIIKSNTVEQIIEVYVEDINSVILNENGTKFNSETLKNIANENKEEIKGIIAELVGEDAVKEMGQEEFDRGIEEFINEGLAGMVEGLPKPQEVVENIPKDTLEVIRVFNSGVVTNVCVGFCAVLFVIILLLRLREYSFFIWFSVILIVTAVFLSSTYSVFAVLPGLISEDLPVSAETVGSIIAVLTQNILITAIVMFVLAAVFMAAFFVIRKIRNKKEENPVEEVPMQA